MTGDRNAEYENFRVQWGEGELDGTSCLELSAILSVNTVEFSQETGEHLGDRFQHEIHRVTERFSLLMELILNCRDPIDIGDHLEILLGNLATQMRQVSLK